MACDARGVALGPIALVDALSSNGKYVYRPRPAEEIARALALAYGPFAADDLARRLSGLDVAARALEAGDLAKAGIATVLLKLPPLSAEAFAKLAQEPTLKKYSPDQTRDERGRWTTDGSDTGSHGTAFAGGREGSHTSVRVKPTMLADSRSAATATDATTNGANGTNDEAQSVAAVPPDVGSHGATQVAETTLEGLKAQHEVARTAIASIWRQSQAEKRKYFGFIYRDQEGNYHATRAVPGVFMSVPQQTADALLQEIPEGATVTASYHTHFNSPPPQR